VELVPSLASLIRRQETALIRLTEEQTLVLDMLDQAPRVGVRGGAGTGKTLLAMELARRWTEEGKRVLLLCYNRFLADYLARGAQGFTVKHFHAFCRDQASAAGVPFHPPRDPAEAEAFWDEQAAQVLEMTIDYLPDDRWDAVVIDEGQDFKELWWLAIQNLLADPAEGRVWVFYDPKQDIYDGAHMDLLGLTPATLSFNCRNTKIIATYANDFVGQKPRLRPHAPDGTNTIEISCKNDDEMIDNVRRILHDLVANGSLSPNQIVILSPRSARTSKVWARKKFGNIDLIEFPQKHGPNQVSFATLQAFKGLESDAIILCEIEEGRFGGKPNHLYVATSRAKHVLAVIKYASSGT
jgi:DNA helicase IV